MIGTLQYELQRAARLSGLARSLEGEFDGARNGSANIEHVLAQLATDEPTEDVRTALDDIFGFAPARPTPAATVQFVTVPAGMRV